MKTTLEKGSHPWEFNLFGEDSDEFKLWEQLQLLKSIVTEWAETMECEVFSYQANKGLDYKVTADIKDVQAMIKYVTKQYERFSKVVRW
tara:strand:- start:138 stop:404 length:267 start_codon:yes stop_codon:yes gene_type:complete